jgi:CheY-like chemotaxis protein
MRVRVQSPSNIADLNDGPAMTGRKPDNFSTGNSIAVLVVDDDQTNRIFLENMLRRDGHTVYSAGDGREAVAVYEEKRPEMVLMDVMMPVMNGYDATREIKSIAGKHFVPVTFLTALTDEPSLINCLEVGGDDFLVKPVSRAILRAKLAAAARLRRLYGELERQQRELNMHHERLRYEHEIAENIFTKVIGSAGIDYANIRVHALPFAITTGDLILAAQTPAGKQYALLGDYTGHGLGAAIGTIPAAEAFKAMTRKGLGLREIISEMNRKLRLTLPVDQFLAACILEWDPQRGIVSLWNGGLPDLIIAPGQGERFIAIPSRNLPLGIEDNDEMMPCIEVRRVHHGDRIYLYSDGLIEARDKEGEMFGEDRMKKAISTNRDRKSLFNEICEGVARFRDGWPPDDDITIVELLCDVNLLQGNDANNADLSRQSDYTLSVQLGPQALRNFDPLSLVECLVRDVNWLEGHRSEIYTIVAELYSNALEYGVLAMNSAIKETPEGFASYYAQRARMVSELNAGWINIDIACFGDSSSGELLVQVEDSGKGFDFRGLVEEARADDYAVANGRGLRLVRKLCKSLSHYSHGNYLRAVYAW